MAGNIGNPSLYRRHACEVDSSSTSQARRRSSSAMALVAGPNPKLVRFNFMRINTAEKNRHFPKKTPFRK